MSKEEKSIQRLIDLIRQEANLAHSCYSRQDYYTARAFLDDVEKHAKDVKKLLPK